MIKKLSTLFATFLLLAGLASAQTVTTFTSPAGAISCASSNNVASTQVPNKSIVVENSTPPYPSGFPNTPYPGETYFVPAEPNHVPIPIVYGCDYMGGFVSASGLYSANLQMGGPTNNIGGWLRVSSGQALQIASIVWTGPSEYPLLGQPATYTFDAQLLAVCDSECHSASGTVHLEGQWAFNWVWRSVYRGGTHIVKNFVNTTPAVITINDQSTVAILD